MNSKSTFQRWLFSIKPASWPKLLVPATLGLALGISTNGLDIRAVGVVYVFTILLGLFIVWMNDWADQRVDRFKREMFPESSHKTIHDGYLNANQIFTAGSLAGLGAIAWGFLAAHLLDNPNLGIGGIICVGIFVAYSLPPIKLNYRGGGELLETFGVGLALPLFAASTMGFDPRFVPWPILGGWVALCLASAPASGLSDEESDRAGGKTTFVTALGNKTVRMVIDLMGPTAIVLTLIVAKIGFLPLWAALVPCAFLYFHWRDVKKLSSNALTNAFDEQRSYKHALHLAIWRYGLVLSICIILAVHL